MHLNINLSFKIFVSIRSICNEAFEVNSTHPILTLRLRTQIHEFCVSIATEVTQIFLDLESWGLKHNKQSNNY